MQKQINILEQVFSVYEEWASQQDFDEAIDAWIDIKDKLGSIPSTGRTCRHIARHHAAMECDCKMGVCEQYQSAQPKEWR